MKFPTREHYISKELARRYLRVSRETIEDKFAPSFLRNAYVLNILISEHLTKPCFDLITSGTHQNMDMLFNPKLMNDEEILRTISKALATKFRNWSDKLKRKSAKIKHEYHPTQKGTIRIDKRIEPYGMLKKQIADIDRAADIFEVLSGGLKK